MIIVIITTRCILFHQSATMFCKPALHQPVNIFRRIKTNKKLESWQMNLALSLLLTNRSIVAMPHTGFHSFIPIPSKMAKGQKYLLLTKILPLLRGLQSQNTKQSVLLCLSVPRQTNLSSLFQITTPRPEASWGNWEIQTIKISAVKRNPPMAIPLPVK